MNRTILVKNKFLLSKGTFDKKIEDFPNTDFEVTVQKVHSTHIQLMTRRSQISPGSVKGHDVLLLVYTPIYTLGPSIDMDGWDWISSLLL